MAEATDDRWLDAANPTELDALAQALARRFPADEVDVVAGDLQTARAFTALPFDHILFTGSGRVGREVMRAAAEHLTPVTLELVGKSPAIVAPGYPIEHAAERIVVGKCMNAGQTCIAPDYALVPEASLDAFVAAARDWAGRLYPAVFTTPDYSSIVSDAQFDRLAAMLDEAGLTLGYPEAKEPLSARLGLQATVHTDRYDTAAVERALDTYGPRRGKDWIGDKVKQYGVATRADFGGYVRGKKFGLD